MTDEEIIEVVSKIDSMYRERMYRQEDIAKEFGLSIEQVRLITQRLGYHHSICKEKTVVIFSEEWRDIFKHGK